MVVAKRGRSQERVVYGFSINGHSYISEETYECFKTSKKFRPIVAPRNKLPDEPPKNIRTKEIIQEPNFEPSPAMMNLPFAKKHNDGIRPDNPFIYRPTYAPTIYSGEVAVEQPEPMGPVRTAEEILALQFVPKLRLDNGTPPDLAVVEPEPVSASTTWADEDVFRHIGTMWSDVCEKLYGKKDPRLLGLSRTKKREKVRKRLRQWWDACAEKDVKPMEWVIWTVESWLRYKPGKRPEYWHELTAEKVLNGKIRRIFRLNAHHLGGRMTYNPRGRELLHRVTQTRREIKTLVLKNKGVVSDDQVNEIVLKYFPHGVTNAKKIMVDIHTTCTATSMDLLSRSKRGHYVWEGGNDAQDGFV